MRRYAYDEALDGEIVRLDKAGFRPGQIATAMGRPVKSISSRMVHLRKLGLVSTVAARQENAPIPFAPAIVLKNDDQLIEACLAEGGFPKAVTLAGRTFWLNHAGVQWRHAGPTKAARAYRRQVPMPAPAQVAAAA